MGELFCWHYDLKPGFEFDCVRYQVDPEGESLHWHDYYQLALCVEGEGTFTFEEKVYDYAPGDIFVVDNTERHGAQVEPGHQAGFLFVMFAAQFVARSTESTFDYEYLLPLSYNSEDFCNKIPGDTHLAHRLQGIMLELEAENQGQQPGYQHLIGAKLRVALAELLRHYGVQPDSVGIVDRHRKLRPAILFMQTHCQRPLTLEEVATTVYLSPSRFRHLFQETMHLGFKEYLISLRYAMARRMLATTDLSVSSIGEYCGFSNLNTLYRLFSEKEGLTPAQYRQRVRPAK